MAQKRQHFIPERNIQKRKRERASERKVFGEKKNETTTPGRNMIKWYFIKLLPVFIWILLQHLHAANADGVGDGDAVDAINDEDAQVKTHIFNS